MVIPKEELPLLINDDKVVPFDGLEQWQVDTLTKSLELESVNQASVNLQMIDSIIADWLATLSKEDWQKIKQQRSLRGITLPALWIKTWRIILKEPTLRDPRKAARQGLALRSYVYTWNIWAEQCLNKYLSEMEKELLKLVDIGYPYIEIGNFMLSKYGDDFWKPRKSNTTTTVSQVVNYYLYWKMPNKIARSELTDLVLQILIDPS